MFRRSHHPLTICISGLLAMALFLVAVPQTYAQSGASAQDEAAEQEQTTVQESDLTVGVQGGRFGVGFASAWPAYGISGTLQVSEKLTAEAVVGLLGTVSNIGGRVWYRFKPDLSYDLYGYGGAGLYRYGYFGGAESVLGLGAGVGIEAGLAKLFDDEEFPPIFVNAELGLAHASFRYYGGFSSLAFGAGIHYRFGGN